jgi:hypothetical protein
MAANEEASLAYAGRKIWKAASDLIALHGGQAPLYAMQTVHLSIERGDLAGASRWRLVWRAVEVLLSDVPASPHGYH